MKIKFGYGIGKFILFGIRPKYFSHWELDEWSYDYDQYERQFDLDIYFLCFAFHMAIYWKLQNESSKRRYT